MASKATLTKEKLAELVKCVLCMKTFTSPQTMKCLHTFCKHCLENHAKRSSVDDVQGLECPRCKQFTAQGDVTPCTRTEQLLASHVRVTQPKMCFECETESAEWKCQDCGDFYCETCKEMHFKIKKFKNHKIVATMELQDDVMSRGFVYCTEHSEEKMRCFCFDCDVMLCCLCLLQGHDGHERDTVHNAIDYVRSMVEGKLTDVKQITNERFLRAEKLKDTRLLIQTYADESRDAIESRYEFLKQKLEDDYQSLTQELNKVVDVEFEKVNAAISSEEAKQSHATAVTSYVETVLTTTTDAFMVQAALDDLKPKIDQFSKAEKDLEKLHVPIVIRFKQTPPSADCKQSLLGKLEKIPADFHSRYQPEVTSRKFESSVVGKTINIDLGKEALAHRISVGYGKLLVCYTNLNMIHVYDTHSSDSPTVLDLQVKLKEPRSACFVNDAEIAVASISGLAIVSILSYRVTSTISSCAFSDVNCIYAANQLYAINITISAMRVAIATRAKGEWMITSFIPLDCSETLSRYSTIIPASRSIYFCNKDSKIDQYSLRLRARLGTLSVAKRNRLLCVDVDGRVLMSRGSGHLVLHGDGNNSDVTLDGVTSVEDLVFEDPDTFWILENVDDSKGKWKLVKFTFAER